MGYCEYCKKENGIECSVCKKSYCNDTTNGISHIVTHLVYYKHKEISQNGKKLRCSVCNENNVFFLYLYGDEIHCGKCFSYASNNKTGKSRQTLEDGLEYLDIKNESLDEIKKNMQKETEKGESSGYKKKHNSAEKLEKLIENKKITNEKSEISNVDFIPDIKTIRIPKKFEKGKYQKMFSILISEESKKEQEVKKNMTQNNTILRFEGKYCYYYFRKNNIDFKIGTGDIVSFRYNISVDDSSKEILDNLSSADFESGIERVLGNTEVKSMFVGSSAISNYKMLKYNGPQVFTGFICRDQFNDEIKVLLDGNKFPKTGTFGGFIVEYPWSDMSYKKMQNAIKQIEKYSDRNLLFRDILTGHSDDLEKTVMNRGEDTKIQDTGFPVPIKHFHVKNFKEKYLKLCKDIKKPVSKYEIAVPSIFNESQIRAVMDALKNRITLIQGPPGTGKTLVSSVIVKNFVKFFKQKVLVVAPSNIAVDHLTKKINSLGLKVLRIVSKRREETPSEMDFLSLHRMTEKLTEIGYSSSEAVYKIISESEVVCCTSVCAGKHILKGFWFPFVLMDEAVQSVEPLSIIPCTHGALKLVLIGDQKQLGPTVLSNDARKAGLGQSLFERLMKLGVTSCLLSIQYRMHPNICDLPSEEFYNGLLTSSRSRTILLKFPNNFFYCCNGKEELNQTGTSFLNKSEAVLVEDVVRYLFKNGIGEHQIGVITPYEGQRSYILNRIFGSEPGNLEIANVDGFQGREKDFIIVSLVRSNDYQGIGFLGDQRRINVALTRARHGLVIIGNPYTLSQNKMWERIINWYKKHDSVYMGRIDDLKKMDLH